jgi:hypothetical protein
MFAPQEFVSTAGNPAIEGAILSTTLTMVKRIV